MGDPGGFQFVGSLAFEVPRTTIRNMKSDLLRRRLCGDAT